MKPADRCAALPEQAACIRAENACLLLRDIIPEPLYLQVRTAVCQWDIASDPVTYQSIAKQAMWDKRKAG